MSDQTEENITMNLKLLTFALAIVISIFGFFITRTLNSIDQNIVDVKLELQRKSEVLGNHETRIQLLERSQNQNNQDQHFQNQSFQK
jgi:hypothetical protein